MMRKYDMILSLLHAERKNKSKQTFFWEENLTTMMIPHKMATAALAASRWIKLARSLSPVFPGRRRRKKKIKKEKRKEKTKEKSGKKQQVRGEENE